MQLHPAAGAGEKALAAVLVEGAIAGLLVDTVILRNAGQVEEGIDHAVELAAQPLHAEHAGAKLEIAPEIARRRETVVQHAPHRVSAADAFGLFVGVVEGADFVQVVPGQAPRELLLEADVVGPGQAAEDDRDVMAEMQYRLQVVASVLREVAAGIQVGLGADAPVRNPFDVAAVPGCAQLAGQGKAAGGLSGADEPDLDVVVIQAGDRAVSVIAEAVRGEVDLAEEQAGHPFQRRIPMPARERPLQDQLRTEHFALNVIIRQAAGEILVPFAAIGRLDAVEAVETARSRLAVGHRAAELVARNQGLGLPEHVHEMRALRSPGPDDGDMVPEVRILGAVAIMEKVAIGPERQAEVRAVGDVRHRGIRPALLLRRKRIPDEKQRQRQRDQIQKAAHQ